MLGLRKKLPCFIKVRGAQQVIKPSFGNGSADSWVGKEPGIAEVLGDLSTIGLQNPSVLPRLSDPEIPTHAHLLSSYVLLLQIAVRGLRTPAFWPGVALGIGLRGLAWSLGLPAVSPSGTVVLLQLLLILGESHLKFLMPRLFLLLRHLPPPPPHLLAGFNDAHGRGQLTPAGLAEQHVCVGGSSGGIGILGSGPLYAFVGGHFGLRLKLPVSITALVARHLLLICHQQLAGLILILLALLLRQCMPPAPQLLALLRHPASNTCRDLSPVVVGVEHVRSEGSLGRAGVLARAFPHKATLLRKSSPVPSSRFQKRLFLLRRRRSPELRSSQRERSACVLTCG
mmetsp:Transcript_3323/g.7486  ORF Transcript_3323/g.7486 Transcript_3323/m.7486 type:complete len:341 (-) Transcript_3323:375-1397(-)